MTVFFLLEDALFCLDELLTAFITQLGHAHGGIVVDLHKVSDYNDSSFPEFLLDVHQRLFPRLDFLLMTSDDTVWDILAYVNRIDSFSNRTTDFNYHSKWLVLLNSGNVDKFAYNLHSLQHVTFIQNVCGVQMSSFIYSKTVDNATEYSGFSIDLLKALARRLNFTYEFVEPTHGTWGVLDNGSWNGLVGMMERREADLALADLSININRSKVMDYLLPPIYYDKIDIVYKEENSIPSTWMTFLRPFSPIVFMSIAVSTVGFFVLYSAAMVVIRNKYTCRKEPRTVTDVVWFTISSLFKQGTTIISPSTHGIRILVSAWLLFSLVVITEYTGHLTAAFTVLPEPKLFKSLRQILDHPQYKIGMVKGAITSMLLENSNNPEYREVWSYIVENRKRYPEIFSESEETHLKKVKGGNYALIDYDSTLRMFMIENCGLQRLGISLEWQPVSLGVPLNSTLKVDLERVMRRLEASGIFNYWWYVHMSQLKHITCPSRQRSVSSSITLDDIKSGFVLLGAGIGAAVLSLAAEVLKKKLM
ncbi:glutamate receptor ionotropic, kainate 4-like [Gigantopelta aegis]|uniref:glutamate receptor ionotropic, kainate 4-like n=1 Tax=Gigantopelta aegis TaxID=1735272 RepID=UPI001B88CCFF|nr:glutamate receptor ionotropic, kainate 4-like [Gigantopelta aegis]